MKIRDLTSTPNLLTLLRMIFIPFIATAVLEGDFAWALGLFIVAGLSDGLDGLLARWMNQRTVLGQYLDPIADKLLLSTMFLVLAVAHKIPWKFTIMVFSRDLGILVVSAVLYMTTPLRDFTPSIYGKANTVAQIFTIFLVMVNELTSTPWITDAKNIGLWCAFALTLISWIHYTLLVGYRLRHAGNTGKAATP
ncbi:MAG TPA: CDP-alcohol phosphatidyltransferase family protein [Terriglobales bacterium]|nr:CDP-alcohol phosphatidyltransferase family protein [Terriglobales bacterium]